jgi:hypothetical protein
VNSKAEIAVLVLVPLITLAVLIYYVLAHEGSAGRLAVEVGLLLSAYSMWSLSAGGAVLEFLDLRDGSVELAAVRGMLLVLGVSLFLVVLGFLNLFGALPWT